MRVRRMTKRDWTMVPRFMGQYPFAWKFPFFSRRIAAACVIEDDSGTAIAICAAEKIPVVTVGIQQTLHPTVRLRAVAMIHEYMIEALKDFPEMTCEVPPELERGYGRHLQRIFGWREMWKGYKLKGSPTI